MASMGLNLAVRVPTLSFIRQRRGLRAFIIISALDELNAQMLSVAIAWYVYSSTGDPMSLACVALARFLPNIAVTLIAGPPADRFDRRRIIGLTLLLQLVCSGAFCYLAATDSLSARSVYLLLLLISAAQAFSAPAMSARLPHLVSTEEFPRAVAVTSAAFQICNLVGPAFGGLLYRVSGTALFAVSTSLCLVAISQLRWLGPERQKRPSCVARPVDVGPLVGIRYIRANKLLLAVISLDLFAVLLGGITALLPIYARDILAVGPAGLGWLRCAPGFGAAIIGIVLARRTIKRGAGRLMLACVAGFGLATIWFALSSNFWLSVASLIAIGGFDMVSMVIRQTMVQIFTPDTMRGRVGAVQWVCIGASSELGQCESGIAAALLGAVPAALLGGLATLAIVAIWARLFPELPRADGFAIQPATDPANG